MRYLCLLSVIGCYVTYFMYMDAEHFFVPFTNWALMITTISLIASISASNDTVNFGHDALVTKDNAVFA